MHKRLVASVVSRLVCIVAVAMVFPLVWAFYDNPGSREVWAFSFTIGLGLIGSLFFSLLFPVQTKQFEKLNAKDGLAIVGFSWIVMSVFGAIPLYLSGSFPSFLDAIFETASGFTTTGATVAVHIEALPRGILFWRSMTHWLGGMGIIVLYLALLPAIGQAAFQLYRAEAPGPTAERLQPRIKETAKVLWGVYVLFSVLETVLLMAGGMPLFDALCHTFGTMATGGFSTKTQSIAAYSPYIQWVIIVFMIIAGTNFMLHFQALRGRWKSYLQSEEFLYYTGTIIFLIPFFTLILARHSLESPFRKAAFQVVSIMTTTGFTTDNFDIWPKVLRIILFLLMFIGGCAGSTGGGMKVVRVFLAMKTAGRAIIQALFPNAVLPVKFDKKPVSQGIILGILSYVMIFVSLFFAGAIILSLTDKCDLTTAMSASIACLGNIGPGLGKVGANSSYAWISSAGKSVLIFLMLAGRLELYSILILFSPAAWRK